MSKNLYFSLKLIFFCILCACNTTKSNDISLNENINKQYNSDIELDSFLAESLAKMPIKCLLQEYPNKTSHTAANNEDQLQTPSQLHPSFYGCFDWHSSVHGHWMLVRLINIYPNLSLKDTILTIFNHTLQQEKLLKEVDYFEKTSWGVFMKEPTVGHGY